MRYFMFSVLFLTGCACKKQAIPIVPEPCPQGTIIYSGPKIIVDRLPEPDVAPPPPVFQPSSLPKVKIIDVTPLPPVPKPNPRDFLPIDNSAINLAKKTMTIKLIVLENPPYNGVPSVGCELGWIY